MRSRCIGVWRLPAFAAACVLVFCNAAVAGAPTHGDEQAADAASCVRQAERLADAGWYDRSLRRLADAVDADRSAPGPRLALGGLLAELQQPAEAREVLEPLLHHADTSIARQALVRLAVAWAGSGNGTELTKFLERHRDAMTSVDAPPLRALACLAQGRFARAAESAETRAKPDSARDASGDAFTLTLLSIVASQANERLGRYEAAMRHLERLAVERPHRPMAFDLLARFCLRNPGHAGVAATLDRLEDASPHLVALTRASLLTRERDLDAAEAALRDTLQRAVNGRHPAAIDLAEALAEVRFEQGETTVAAFAPLVRADWLPATAILHAADWRARERERPIEPSLWRRAADHVSDDEPEAHGRIAERLWQAGERDAAIEALQRFVEDRGSGAWTLRRLAAMLEAQGRIERAIAVLGAAVEAQPRHAGLSLQWAETWDRSGDLDAAERAYRRAMELDAFTRAEAAMRLQELFERVGMPGEALLVLDAVAADRADARPGNPHAELHLRRANLALDTGQPKEAEASWRVVMDHPSHRAAADVGLARLALRRGEVDAARSRIEKLVRQDPAGVMRIARGDPGDADAGTLFALADAALAVRELDPPDAKRWLARRFEYRLRREQWRGARQALAKWNALDDLDREAAALYATMLVDAGEAEAARSVVRRAGLDRRDPPDALTLAVGLDRRGSRAEGDLSPLLAAIVAGRADRARASVRAMPHTLTVHRRDVHAMFDGLDITDPAYAEAARRLAAAVAALEHGQPRLTAFIAQRLAAEHPELILAHALWAQGCWAAHDRLEPVASAVQRDAPRSVLAKVLAALQAHERGDPESARAAFAEALRSEPGNAHLTYRLAEAEAEAGDIAGAIRRLAHLRSRSPVYRRKAAERLIELTLSHRPERYTAMVEWIEKACGDSPAPAVLAAAGRAAAQAGDHDRASRWLRHALALGERDAATHLALAEIHESRNHRTWALRHLDAALASDADPIPVAQARTLRERLTQTAEVATE